MTTSALRSPASHTLGGHREWKLDGCSLHLAGRIEALCVPRYVRSNPLGVRDEDMRSEKNDDTAKTSRSRHVDKHQLRLYLRIHASKH